MSEPKTYTCPYCGGQPLPDRWQWTGYETAKVPQVCSLCEDTGRVTLDGIMERAQDPLFYFRLILGAQLATYAEPDDDDASDIPF